MTLRHTVRRRSMERSVTDSVTERAREQGARLQQMREAHRVGKGRILDVLEFKTTQAYDLYERGISVIRLDRVEDWAMAFDLDLMTFLGEVMGRLEISAEAESYSLRDDLRGELQESDLDNMDALYGGEDPADQRVRAKHGRRAGADQREATRPERQNRPA